MTKINWCKECAGRMTTAEDNFCDTCRDEYKTAVKSCGFYLIFGLVVILIVITTILKITGVI